MHPKRSMTALLVLLVGVGAIWFYLPRATTEEPYASVSYAPQSPVELEYASTTSLYRGALFIESCDVVSASMLPVGSSTLSYTLAITIQRQSFCTSVGAVPHAFSAQMPSEGRFAGVTINGAIVPYTTTH